tara:strand:+ start:3159 stop:3587 length:429 start_codon:yes stop_codon:yes gene_type:complete
MYKIIIPGDPIAKPRPKFAKRGSFVSVYDPGKKESDAIKVTVLSQWPHKPIESPIELTIVFFMPIPASWSKKRIDQAIRGEIKHTKKPDGDNLCKKYFDCMNKTVYVDDAQIYKYVAEKKYDLIPRTEINIVAFNPETCDNK